MKYTWRQINVWLGIETTRWTKSSTIAWFPKTNANFQDKIETIEDESALGLKIDTSDIDIARHYAEWSLEWKVQANNIWYLLYSILWNKTTTTITASKVFSHLFKIENSWNNPSLTIFTKEWNGDYNFPLAIINSLTINATVWESITVSANFKSKKGVSDTLTTTYWTDYPFKAKHSTFKIANDKVWLTSAPVACIESFELTITKETLEDYCLNNGNEPIDITDGKIGITWSITAVFNDNNYKDIALNGTQKAMEFSLEDTATDIAWEAWKNPLIKFVMPKVKFTEYWKDMSNDSLVKQNLSFKVFQNTSDIEAIEVTLQNGQTNY